MVFINDRAQGSQYQLSGISLKKGAHHHNIQNRQTLSQFPTFLIWTGPPDAFRHNKPWGNYNHFNSYIRTSRRIYGELGHMTVKLKTKNLIKESIHSVDNEGICSIHITELINLTRRPPFFECLVTL
jgi:hypothetical protein